MADNIWTTVECDACSRDFDYKEYCDLHTQRKEIGKTVSYDMYIALCEVFNDEFDRTA